MGAGPVVGYGAGRGLLVGWEAGGGPMTVSVNVGQSYRPGPDPSSPPLVEIESGCGAPIELGGGDDAGDRPTSYEEARRRSELASASDDPGARVVNELVTYAVLEPWFYVGATIGAAWEWDTPGTQLAAGLWEGVPLSSQEVPRTANRTDLLPAIGLTIAAGYRYLAGGHELYLAPKLHYAWNQAY